MLIQEVTSCESCPLLIDGSGYEEINCKKLGFGTGWHSWWFGENSSGIYPDCPLPEKVENIEVFLKKQ